MSRVCHPRQLADFQDEITSRLAALCSNQRERNDRNKPGGILPTFLSKEDGLHRQKGTKEDATKLVETQFGFQNF